MQKKIAVNRTIPDKFRHLTYQKKSHTLAILNMFKELKSTMSKERKVMRTMSVPTEKTDKGMKII